MNEQQVSQLVTYVVTAIVVGVILYFRMRRMSRQRPLRVERLWIFPAIFAAVAAYLYATHPPHGMGWAWCLIALIVGAAAGWQWGRLMRIHVDPETHALNQSQSPFAILFLLGLVAIRIGSRAMLMNGVTLGGDAMLVTDVLIAFALGLFVTQRLEMYLRANRMLEEARASVS
ncbi:CcdC protein domain-containing protein [Stakelama tenebrarum]|uniref:DUF1453 family protein n=1 Tax=Stakelama tenebrarum TaxID=2711215 RepID=A0A6G6Y2N4_9SPHN|nr:CcdC protein domain-containing protein [Sphingosinithalassobacter tenebrarum]QIG79160.1 DUF1453 family protein [Sphingosinithalassobacter tenebrarum]